MEGEAKAARLFFHVLKPLQLMGCAFLVQPRIDVAAKAKPQVAKKPKGKGYLLGGASKENYKSMSQRDLVA